MRIISVSLCEEEKLLKFIDREFQFKNGGTDKLVETIRRIVSTRPCLV